MEVQRRCKGEPDVIARFRRPEHLRAFFAPGTDPMTMLLTNDLVFEGNLAYLSRFAHISAAATARGGRDRMAPQEPEQAWKDLPTPPVGEPARSFPDGEARFLKDPHLADRSLDDFPRVRRLLAVHRYESPAICAERPRLLTDFVLANPDPEREETPSLRQARAMRHILTGKEAIVRDEDLLLGTTTSKRIGVVLYPETHGTTIWPELLTVEGRAMNPYRISDEDLETLDREIFPFWMEENVREWTRREHGNPECLRLDERFVLYFQWKTVAVSHTVADVPSLLSRGLDDIAAEAARRESEADEPGKRDFFAALKIGIEGVTDYAARIAAEAEGRAASMPEGDPRRDELLEMARVSRKVPAGPAESVHEALQSLWTYFLALHQENTNAGLSIGRLDTWLEPYLEKDLDGAKDPDELKRRVDRALELVCAFMLKLTDHLPLVPEVGNRLFGGSSSDQVITLGGVREDGSSAVSDASWLLLKATEMLRLRDPNVNARHAPGVNSEEWLRRLAEVNLLTRATPSLHNDDAVISSLLHEGFSLEHARDWTATGCVEPTSCGRHYGHTGCIMFNLVAPLEMALNDGVHPILGERIGPRTGDPRAFRDFEAFFQAWESQLCWLVERAVEANNILGRAHQRLRPSPLLSAVFQGPMESGRDVIDGGALYNSTGAAMVALSDVVDSLVAIGTLVYERRTISFDSLLGALEADFVGHEALHAELLNKVPKLGQEHALPREMAARIQARVYDAWHAHENYRGGRYVPGYWSMSNHVAFGLLSGALPSGRRRAKAFTPGLTPSHLAGAPLTEQIHTVAGLEPKHMPNNIAFNVRVVPGAEDAHADVVDRMTAYVASYFELGGMQMQFNVVDTATLKDAMERPEEYRDLLVRISGYNAYFTDLNRDMQLELVERMEHRLG
jgi:pyruvate formate-lyase/glycerol dehydratase family glycyl radical enzyme